MKNYEILEVIPLNSTNETNEYIISFQAISNTYKDADVFEVVTNRNKYIIKIYYRLLWSDKVGFRRVYNISLYSILTDLNILSTEYDDDNCKGGVIEGGYKDNCNEYLNIFNND